MTEGRVREPATPRAVSAQLSDRAIRVWIDVENPPQVQYLLPFRRAFAELGIETIITARDYGSTLEMLKHARVPAHPFGTRVAGGKLRKATASCLRARELFRFLNKVGAPDAALSSSRAAPLAAWRLRIPSFLMCDYEHANVSVSRLARTTLLHPDVIDPAVFRHSGLRTPGLYAFKGVKEDLTFADVDISAADALDLGAVSPDAVRVLFRPPSETSHYYREASSRLSRATLEFLAGADALVVFSPREREQVRMLDGLNWRHQPIVLQRPVPFLSLLKSVDLVISSGGTMLREGAYLGIPSYSILQSEIGAVDRWLEEIGHAKLLSGEHDLHKIELRKRGPLRQLNSNPDLLAELVGVIAGAATNHRQSLTAAPAGTLDGQ